MSIINPNKIEYKSLMTVICSIYTMKYRDKDVQGIFKGISDSWSTQFMRWLEIMWFVSSHIESSVWILIFPIYPKMIPLRMQLFIIFLVTCRLLLITLLPLLPCLESLEIFCMFLEVFLLFFMNWYSNSVFNSGHILWFLLTFFRSDINNAIYLLASPPWLNCPQPWSRNYLWKESGIVGGHLFVSRALRLPK